MKEPICFAAAVTVLLATSALHADVVVLQPDAADLQDTWIWNGDDFPHGGDRELRANQTTSFDQRILIQFLDLSAIPDNAIINSAMLELFRYDAFNNSPLTLSAYRVLEPWPEDVTFSGQPSHDAVAEDAIVVTVDGWYSWDLTSLVQAYVDDSATNHGVTIYDSGTGFFQRFASSDVDGPGVGPLHPGPDFRPKLTVDFNVIPAADCSGFPCGNNDQKVLLCHVPPGNPDNEHTVCISPNAVAAHLENHEGDHCGPCDDDGLSSVSGRAAAGGVVPCPGDVNIDGAVNVLDLIDVLLCFGQPAVPGCGAEDINGDGATNVLDLIDLLLAFGTTCP